MARSAKKTYSTGAWLFIAPALVVLLAVGIAPLIFALWTSFQQFLLPKVHLKGAFLNVWPIFDAPVVWLSNYRQLLFDQPFHEALGRSLLFLVINLPIQLALGTLIALLLHRPGNEWVKNIARVSLVIPMATTFAVVGLMGRLLFNNDFGFNNFVWSRIFGHGIEWLANSQFAFVSISIMDCWQWTPFCALVLYSSLTMVPVEIEEAAQLETDKWWHVLRKVQLPFLLPGITAILILRTADILKMFDVVYIMTRGGPGSATELISIYIQRIGFRSFDQGMASAQAIVLLILTIILSRIYIRFIYREI
ncbi:MAG TPA: sugar ABC transporter permease [Chthoniobacterales bacterium]|nr:sugar ABC transporter permease [Chthoniobacterales bacterium]